MKGQKASIAAVAGSHGMMHAYLVVLPALIPLMQGELGNLETLGLLASLVAFFYGWGSLPVGFIADRVSRKGLIIASMALCGGSAILISFSYFMPVIALGFMMLGIGASLYHPPGYSHMALLSSELRGRYMGIQGIGGDLGMAFAYLTSTVIGAALGWRQAFFVWGALGLVAALMDLFLVVEMEEDSGPYTSRESPVTTIKKMFSTGRRGMLALVFLIVILSGMLWQGVSAFILAYISDVKGVALVIAGGLSTLKYTVGAFAQMIGGDLSDRRGRRGILLVGFGVFAVSLFGLTLAPASLPVMVLLVVVLGFSFFVTQSPMNALLGDVSHRDTVGVTYGVNFTMKYGIGFFTPALAGFLATNYSLNYVFYFFALLSALAFAASILIRE